MGLFEKKPVSREEQRDFAESNFYEYYGKFAGRSVRSRDDYVIAEIHAAYAELQYLRDLQSTIVNLRVEVAKLREEIELMKK